MPVETRSMVPEQSRHDRYYWILALVCIACSGVFVFQGLDLCDTGSHLSHQLNILHGGLDSEFGMIWLSNWIGAQWLRLCDGLGLLGVRLGWVASVALMAVLVHGLLVKLFSPLASALGAFAGAALYSTRSIMMLNYDTVPAVFALAACVCFGHALLAGDERTAKRWAAVAGVVLMCALQARLPLLGLLAAFICLGLMPVALFPSWGRGGQLSRLVIVWCLGAFLALLVWLAAFGELGAYVEGYARYVATLQDRGVGAGSSLRMLRQLADIAVVAAAVFSLSAACFLVKGKASARLGAAGAFALAVACVAWRYTRFKWTFPPLVGIGLVAGLAAWQLLRLYVLLRRGPDSRRQTLFVLLLLGGAHMVAQTMFTTSGLSKANFGMGLILGLTSALGASGEGLSVPRWANGYAKLFTSACVAALVVSAFASQVMIPVRGYARDRARMTSALELRRAPLIFTDDRRAKMVREVVREIEQRADADSTLFTYLRISMLQFLSGTRPAHPGLAGESVWRTEEELREQARLLEQHPPDFVVKAKVDTLRTMYAPRAKAIAYDYEVERTALFDKVLRAGPWRIVWENEWFALYALNP